MNDNAKTKKQLIAELQELRQRVAELERSEQRPHEQALRRQNEYLAALHETTLGLISHLDLDELLHAIVSRAGALVGTTHGYIYLLETDGNAMTLRIGIGIQSESVGHRIKPGEGIAGRVWRSGQPLVIDDYKNWEGRPPGYERSVLQTAVGVPLKSGDQVIGVIGLAYTEAGRAFGQAEVEILTRFAQLAAVALDNARLFHETQAALAENETLARFLQKQALQLRTAAEVSRAATSILDLNELLSQAVELIRERFDLYYTGIFLVDREGRYAVLRAGTGQAGRKMLEAGHKLEVGGTSMIGWCVANARGRIALDVGQEAVRFSNPYLPDTRSELALPLISRGRAIGAMTVQSAQAAAFSDEDIATLQTMADQIANAIENARLFRETQQRLGELSTLNEIGQVFSVALQLDELPEIIYRQVQRLFDADSFYIALYEADRGEWATVFDLVRGQRQPAMRHKAAAGLTGHIIHTRQGLLLRNAQENEAFCREHGIARLGEPAKTWLGAPLVAADQVIGVMAIENYEQEDIYDEQDKALFSTIAGQAASAIQNARLFQETRQRVTQLSILNEIGQAFSAALKLDELLEIIYQQFSRIFDTTNFFIATYQEGSDEWIMAFQVEQGQRGKLGARKLGIGLTSHILRTRRPILLRNLEENAAFFEQHQIQRSGVQAKSWMGVPLIAAGRLVGVMAIQSYDDENLYDEQDLALFSTIAAQAATAVQNARLFEETQRRVAELSTLNEIGQVFSSALNLDELQELVHRQISRLFDAANFYIALYKEGEDEWVSSLHFERGQRQPVVRRKISAGLTGYIIRQRVPLLFHTASEDVEFLAREGTPYVGEPAKSWMGVPLVAAGQVVGVMAIQSYEHENLYTQQDLALFSTIAAQAAVAIQNARLFAETEQRVTQMSILNEIGRAFAASLNLDELLETIHRQVGRIFDASNFFITSYTEGDSEWRMVFYRERGQPGALGPRPLGAGLTSHILRTRQPILFASAPEITAFHAERSIPMVGDIAQAWMGVPLIAAGKIVGTMTIQSYDQPNLYTPQDLELFSTIAAQAAAAIQNARLFQETRRRVAELSTLNDMSRAIAAALNLDELLETVCQQVGRVFDAANFYLALHEQASGQWTMAVEMSHGQRQAPRQVNLEVGMTGYIIRNRQPLLLRNLAQVQAFHAEQGLTPSFTPAFPGEWARLYMGVPLVAADQVVGVIAIRSFEQENLYTEQDLELLSTMGAQVAIAIQNARLFEETRQRVTELSILNEIGQAFASALNLDELLEIIYQQVGRVFGATDFYIAAYEEGSGEWADAFNVEHGERRPLNRYKLGQGLTSYLIKTRQPVLWRTAQEGAAFLEAHQIAALGEMAQSWMGVPLVAGGKVVGAMGIQNYERENVYAEQDLALLSTIAAQAATALQNARLFQETQKRMQQTQLLLRMSEAAASTLDSIEIMRRMAREAALALGADMAGAYMLNEAGDKMQPVAGYHVPPEKTQIVLEFHPPLAGNPFIEEACRNQRTVFSSDVNNDPRFDADLQRVLAAQSVLLTPMIIKNTVIGGLWLVWWQESHTFTEEQIRLVEGLVRQAGVTADNARLYAEAQQRAQEQEGLARIAALAGSTLEIEELLDRMMDEARQLLDAEASVVLFEDRQRRALVGRYISVQGAARPVPEDWHIPMDAPGFEQSIFARGGAFYSNLGKDDPALIPAYRPYMDTLNVRNFCGVAMRVRERSVGEFYLANRPGGFDKDKLRLMRAMAGYAANAIQNAQMFHQAQARAQQMLALTGAIAQITGPQLNQAELLNQIVQQAQRLLAADQAGIWLAAGPDEIEMQVTTQAHWTGRRLKKGEGLSGRVFATGAPLRVDDYLAWSDHAQTFADGSVQAALCVPLNWQDQTLGVLALTRTQRHPFTPEDEYIAQLFAAQISAAIENARLFEQAQTRAEEMAALNELSRSLTTRLSVDDALDDVYRSVAHLFHGRANNFYAVLYDQEKDQASFALNVVNGQVSRPYSYAPAGRGLTGYVLKQQEPVLIQDDLAGWLAEKGLEPARRPDAPPAWPRAWMGAPMIVGDRHLGMLAMSDYTTPNAYDEHDRDLLMTIASQAAIAIQNIRLFQETRVRAEELAALNELSQALTTRLNVEEVMAETYRGVSRLINADNFYISLYDPDKNEVAFPFQIVNGQRSAPEGAQPLSGLTGYLVRTRKPLLLQEKYDETVAARLGVEYRSFASREPCKCWLGAPLLAGERVLGTIALLNYEDYFAFDEHDKNLLAAIASQASIALQNARLFQETRRRAEEMAILNELSQALTTRLDVQQIAEQIYQGISRLMDTTNFYITLYDPEKQTAAVPLQIADGERLAGERTMSAEGLTGYLIRTRQPLLLQDKRPGEAEAQLGVANIAYAGARDSKCWLGAPILVGERLIGTLTVLSYTDPRAFDEHDRDVLAAIASQAAIAIQNARLFEETRRRAEEMASLNELSQALATRLDVQQIAEQIYQGVSRLMDTTNFYITLYDAEKQTVSLPLRVADGERQAGERVLPASEGLTGYLIRTRQPLLLQDKRPGEAEARLGVANIAFVGARDSKCWLGAPILVGERLIGTLTVLSYTDPRAFDERDRDLLAAIASQAAIAIQNARLFEETRQARDLLSGRVKELDCLNDIGRKINETPPIPEFLEWAAGRIPAAMQYADLCRVAIKYEGQVYGAPEAMTLPRHMIGSLNVGKDIVGQVYIAYTQPREFMHEESALLGDLGRRISGYIENRRLLEQTRATLDETASLYRISADLNAAVTCEDVLQTLRTHNPLIGQADLHASLSLFEHPWDEKRRPERIQVVAYWTPQDGMSKSSMIMPLTDSATHILQRDAPTLIQDVNNDPRLDARIRSLYRERMGARSAFFVPLVAAGQWIGYINALYSQSVEFDAGLVRQVMAMTGQAAVAVQSIRQLEETQRRARREQALREIAARVRASTNPDTIVRTAVRELGATLGRPTFVRLGSAEQLARGPAAGRGETQPQGDE